MKKIILGLDFGNRWNEKLPRWGALALRIGISLLMLRHGWGKIINFSEISSKFPDPFGLGSEISLSLVVGAEFFGSLFLLFGFLTRWSAFSIFFTMIIASLVVDWHDSFDHKELALLYAVAFLYFVFSGSGAFSVDNYLKKKFFKK